MSFQTCARYVSLVRHAASAWNKPLNMCKDPNPLEKLAGAAQLKGEIVGAAEGRDRGRS